MYLMVKHLVPMSSPVMNCGCSKSLEESFFEIACTALRIIFWCAKHSSFSSFLSRGWERSRMEWNQGWGDYVDVFLSEMVCHKCHNMQMCTVVVQLPHSLGVLWSFLRYVHPLKLLQHFLVVGCIHRLVSFLHTMHVDHATLVKKHDGEHLQFQLRLTSFRLFRTPSVCHWLLSYFVSGL